MKAKRSILVILFSAALMFILMSWSNASAYPANAETQSIILYVKPHANGTCASWTDACELQTALANAIAGDQIWVAAGTYKPTSDTDRTATFQLKSDVAIYGGFPAGGGGWETRNWVTNLTNLNGDIGVAGNTGDNSYHVVTGSGVDATAVLDGFTVSGGNANGSDENSSGGGMYNSIGSPSLSNVTFSSNAATYGGGMSNEDSSSPSLSNVTFNGNSAVNYGGGIDNAGSSPSLSNVTFSGNTAASGGGMSNWDSSSPSLSNVTFSGNIAPNGGGMFNYQNSSPSLSNVTFSGNLASYGGGMSNYQNSSPSLSNVTFSGNLASYGGGMSNWDSSSPSLSNVTFSGNSATQRGGGVYNDGSSSLSLSNVTFSGNTATYYGGGMYNSISSPTVMTNSILWGNNPEQIYSDNQGSVTVTYSDIQGGWAGIGNIDQNPLLDDLAENGGFTLTHALGAGSPAIDAGDPNNCPVIDQRAYVRPVDGDEDGTETCDMGAYEYASYPATFSLTIDIVGNGLVTKDPDQTEYLWGEVVSLTPFANPDWLFIGWGGDASGMDNPLAVTIYEDTNITANFRFDAWTLTTSVFPESSGSVVAYPDQPSYHYGDLVTLTAVPNPGWSFAGWTGDASGTSSQVIVTMNDNLEITANFAQIEYSLSVSVNPPGMGTVTKSPDKPYYVYGDIVNLIASSTVTGWRFIGWSGDASGTDNPLTITIVGNTNIVAEYTNFIIYLPFTLR